MKNLWSVTKVLSNNEKEKSVRMLVILCTVGAGTMALMISSGIGIIAQLEERVLVQMVLTCVLFFGVVFGMFGSLLWLLRHI